MIAVTQIRLAGEGAAYYAKQLTAGKTTTEAKRLLRRRISDRVYQALRVDARTGGTESQVAPITPLLPIAGPLAAAA
jgi:transposase